jgi:uncharacterized membrane-anchored protein YhcB (DUF1043 family)
MNITTVTKPLWLRALPYLVAIAVFVAIVVASYMHGVDVTQAKADTAMAKVNQDIAQQREAHAKAKAELLDQMREKDQANADQMAAIDSQHQRAINELQIISDRTIADLRTGTIGLRDKFTTCQRVACGGESAPGTSTGSSDAAASLQLRNEDASVLVLLADEADQVANQLRACQAIVSSDRARP